MYCSNCGEKLTLMYAEGEGLVPFCKACNEFRFAQFAAAVCMVVTNRNKDKILLAKHKGQSEYILFAGYIKKGENAEKAVTREFKEESGLNTVKFKYLGSRYHEPRNVLMFGYLSMAEDGDIVLNAKELDEAAWFTVDEALEKIKKGSTAEAFLKLAVGELKKL